MISGGLVALVLRADLWRARRALIELRQLARRLPDVQPERQFCLACEAHERAIVNLASKIQRATGRTK